MRCVNWGKIPTEWKDHLVLLKDYQYERHWEGSGGFWGPGFPSLKLVSQSTENNNTSSRPLRRSWNLDKCDDQHLSERYILFFWSLEISISKVHADGVGPIHWEVLGIISCHLSLPQKHSQAPELRLYWRMPCIGSHSWTLGPQPASLLLKVVESLGDGASLEELDYGKQTLRFYSLVSVLDFSLLYNSPKVKVQRPEWSTSHPTFTIMINHIPSNF